MVGDYKYDLFMENIQDLFFHSFIISSVILFVVVVPYLSLTSDNFLFPLLILLHANYLDH